MQPCLSLRFVQLKPGYPLIQRVDGICFLLPSLGKGTLTFAASNHHLSAGDIVALCGSSEAKILVRSERELDYWFFHLRTDHLLPLLVPEELSLLSQVVAKLRRCQVYPAACTLAQDGHAMLASIQNRGDLSGRLQLLKLVALVFSFEFKQVRLNGRTSNGAVNVLARGLEKLSIADITNLSVVELAKRFGCSQRHLNRLFNEHFGYSVCAIRMEMRLVKAVSLLRDPGAKILQVAEECGFKHTGLFNSCFKRRFGASPGQFRDGINSHFSRKPKTLKRPANCDMRLQGLCPWAVNPGPSVSCPHEVKQSSERLVRSNRSSKLIIRGLLNHSSAPPDESRKEASFPAPSV